jgi:hypothetical protein
VCLDILAFSFGPYFHPGRIDAPNSFIAIEDPFAFVMCRNPIFHESDPFLLLDGINPWAPPVQYQSRTHSISLLEVIDQTGGTMKFRDLS